MGVRVIPDESEVFEGEFAHRVGCRVDLHLGEWSGVPCKLFAGLIKVVFVQVYISQRVHKLTRLQSSDLGHHHCQQRVARDVEGDAEEQICTALIKLAG